MHRWRIIGGILATGLWAAGTVPAALSVYMPPEELSARATLVVEARVAESRPGLDADSGELHTYITLQIEHVHRGPARLTEVVVREPGGRWGDVVHEVDAVPVYRPGERILAYLEPASDGALRTVGMFFGKFRLEESRTRGPLLATRDLEGQGTILGLAERPESFTRNDLVALTAGVPYRQAPRAGRRAKRERASSEPGHDWSPRPPEWERLTWDDGRSDPRLGTAGGPATARFVALNSSNPSRWNEADSDTAVVVNLQPDGNPLHDNQAAIDEITRAFDAWTNVPQSRLQLTMGDTDFDYTGQYASPSSSFSGVNVVLFDDPYDDISDSTGCGGVLAIGGYWRGASVGAPINNVSFHPSLQLYVIFNNDFECYLSDPDNLAEIAAHELGHAIGFGHSAEFDAIMRSNAYGGRGPRLGADDIDAAHCHYPHTFTLLTPNGGETWTSGDTETILWSSSVEVGGDPGTVDLEYSTDGGSSWTPFATETANDGSHSWTVPDIQGHDVRVRVARHALGTLSSPYPASSCSNDASDASLSVTAPIAGGIGASLTIEKLAGGRIGVSWDASCSTNAETYAVYEGSLAALRSGVWDHAPLTCDGGTDLTEPLTSIGTASYFLVSARLGTEEGSLGVDSSARERPEAAAACGTREVSSTCN
ncbi:MAG: matrixin family metalloprotease [Acidobacteria bacterium]|nr:matrixin family metalloprotease [Acidobacteriota bacterium]NIO59589.1 matrixin family metalloprotease [Acidobacteriota bacterium]NIQ30612.1 matrixin family metalloprotease [Acidobacteriota bacterium]NIT11295.1 matrixin family metalloprotease [Acidobacteriota bacterium]